MGNKSEVSCCGPKYEREWTHCSIYEIPDDPRVRGEANLVHMTRPHKLRFPCPDFQYFCTASEKNFS